MKIETVRRTNVEHECEVMIYADGDQHPTHTIEVRNWRNHLTLNVRTPQGWASVPLDLNAANKVIEALLLVTNPPEKTE